MNVALQNLLFATLLFIGWIPLSAQGGSWAASTGMGGAFGAPTGRHYHVSAWNGSYLLVWGGSDGFAAPVNTGGVYDLSSNSWLLRPNLSGGIGAPTGRIAAVATVVGSKLFVYGGISSGSPTFSNWNGGVYDIPTDTWIARPALNSGMGAPMTSTDGLAAVVDGKVLLWGGEQRIASGFTSPTQGVYRGAVYNTATDSWATPMTLGLDVGHPQFNWSPVWTGSLIIAFGGYGGTLNPVAQSNNVVFSSGGVYSMATDTWLPRPLLGAQFLSRNRAYHDAVWTGDSYIVLGGLTLSTGQFGSTQSYRSDGFLYDPISDQFLVRPALESAVGAPPARSEHSLVWTGRHMLVWGGGWVPSTGSPPTHNPAVQIGDIYDPIGDSWLGDVALTPQASGMTGRYRGVNVTTGDRVLSWGGYERVGGIHVNHNTGGIFYPPIAAPTIRNLNAGQPGTSASNPIVAPVNQPFRHRIVCYGCPESALISPQLPSWLNIGWGGPTSLSPAPGVTNYSPWFSDEGGTADGQWLRGTPSYADVGMHAFTLWATNGVGNDTAPHTVYVEVTAPFPMPYFILPANTVGTAAEDYAYAPSIAGGPSAAPFPVIVPASLPSWLIWNGTVLDGKPPLSSSGASVPVTLDLMLSGQRVTTLSWSIAVDYNPKDVTKDKAIDVVDVQRLVNLILALGTPVYVGEGDVNADSAVDVVDVQAVVNKILSP